MTAAEDPLLPARTMELDGSLFHCGVALTPQGTSARWSGILELRSQTLRCGACDAKVTIREEVPVGPPRQVEVWRDRALAKARVLLAGGDANIGKSFVTGGRPPAPTPGSPS